MRDASQAKGGYIRLYRSLLDWEWFHDSATLHVFVYLLLTACFRPVRHAGVELLPGQLITSLRMIAARTGLSDSQVRTALHHLKSTHEITQQPGRQFSVITLTNFDRYQGLLAHTPLTDGPHTAHAPPAHDPRKNKNVNPVNHVNQEKKRGETPHGRNGYEDRNDQAAGFNPLAGVGVCR